MNLPKHTFLATALLLCMPAATMAQDKVNFEEHVKPIFRSKCASCHNTNKKTADLDLTNYTALMQGGGSGASIEPGDPDSSYLFMLINHDSEPYMPPNSDKLPDAMISTVRKWIELGAPETSSSKVMVPKKTNVDLSVDVSGDRPAGDPPMPDILGLEPVIHTPATTAVSAIATSPWAKLVAVAGQKQVILYNSETLQPLGVLPFPEGEARVLKFSRSGSLLLAGGGHGAAKGLAVVWDVKTGERVMQAGDELDEVLAADISADQSLIALGGPGKVVRVYSTATGELAYEITKHTDWIYSLEFSPDSVLLATSDRSGGLHVWEAMTGRQYLTLDGHKAAVTGVSWRLDSNVLASASTDASVKLWEMENGGNIKSWNAHGGGTESMEFCRDGRIVTCGRDKTTKLWDQNGKQIKAFEAFGDLAVQVSYCDETNRVIAGDWTGEVRVWKADDAARVGNLTTNPPLLEARLQQAEAALAPVNATLAEARKAMEAAAAAKTAHAKNLEAANVAFAAAQKTLDNRKANLIAQQTQLTAATAKQTTTQARVTSLNNAIPDLISAAEKAGQVAVMISDDPALKKVQEDLNVQITARKAELTQMQEALTVVSAEVTALTATVAAETKQLPVDEKLVAEKKTGVDQLVAAQKPIDDSLAATQQSINAAQVAANNAVEEVEKWKQYLALRDELNLLKEKKAAKEAAELASLEAAAAVDEMQQQIASSEQQAQQKAQLIAENQKSITDLNTAIAAAAQEMESVKTQVANHEKAIPVLQVAVEQAKSASGMLPDDAAIKGSVQALEVATAGKIAAVESMKQQLVVVDKKMVDSKAGIVTATTTIETAEKEMAAAKTMVEKLTADSAPMQKQAEEAKAILAAAEAELANVQAIVEARRQELRPKVQVTQVAK